ncbi:MAG: glycoside hydrolase family 27 protein [Clostridia bacterium]|nr:glycoside hydrolase family 27 protein [Clostridia bacterium]
MTVVRPPMGWNSWNTFGTHIDEQLIKDTADKMVSEGLLDCGYNYLVIDDCWALRERDNNGKLVPDPAKFPGGMKAVADYVHSKGLKFGMYSCCGAVTCTGYPSSFGHEFDDAASFAEWEIDFLKYDYCFRDQNVPGEVLYRRMSIALANCGRDILFSACNWGSDNSQNWIKTTGAHMWRSTGDIFDGWGSIRDLIKKQFALQTTNGHGCFNDMDMLVVGMNGTGNVAKNDSNVSFEEYKTHFSAWCMFGSPLMIGCDIRNMTEETKKILMNRDVIAIGQDPLYTQPFYAHGAKHTEDKFIACRLLDGGDIAIGVFNLSDTPLNYWNCYLTLNEIGIDISSGKTLKMRELWTGDEITVKNEIFRPEKLEPHCCRLYRASVVDA